jgi:hypothetical protein
MQPGADAAGLDRLSHASSVVVCSVAPPVRSTSSAPRRNHGGGGRSALATLPCGEDLGFPSSLPLLYTMMCSQFNSCFSFSEELPSCCYCKLWLGAVYDQILLWENNSFIFLSSCCYCTYKMVIILIKSS